jgi:hypothetical protein
MVRIGDKGMTSNEYIVKNCPCLFNSYYASGKTVRFECNDGNHDDKLCRDVTDCVIKQVIEIAKDIIEKDCYENSDAKAEKILQLFDIEEINK